MLRTPPDEHFRRWKYVTHKVDSDGPADTGLFNLYLDEVDERWSTQIDEFDYLIISAGHWFFWPLVFYEKQQRVGCHFCQLENVPDLTKFYGFKRAFRSAFTAINSRKNYKGITYLRRELSRTRPYSSNETTLGGDDMELYLIQIEEFRRAEADGRKRGLKYRLLDTTQAMLLWPGRHPSWYGHGPQEKVVLYNDCVHWCLPGPIHAWSGFLLEMMKTEGRRSR